MIYGLVVAVHVLICLVLIGVILLQGGRGGLSDALGGAAAQSLFGGGVATVMTRVTTICAGLFVVTCLSLAALSTIKGRSVIEQLQSLTPDSLPLIPPAPFAAPTDQEAPQPSPAAPKPEAPTTSTTTQGQAGSSSTSATQTTPLGESGSSR